MSRTDPIASTPIPLPAPPPAPSETASEVDSAEQLLNTLTPEIRRTHARRDAVQRLIALNPNLDGLSGPTAALDATITVDGVETTLGAFALRHGIYAIVNSALGNTTGTGDSRSLNARFAAGLERNLDALQTHLDATEQLAAAAQNSMSLKLDMGGHVVGLTSVDAEGFVALLETNVSESDERIRATRTRIEHAVSESRRIGTQLEMLQALKQRATQDPGITNIDTDMVRVNGEQVLVSTVIQQAGLEDSLNITLTPLGDPNHTRLGLSTDELQAAIDEVRQSQSEATSRNELDMITLQQLMQDRGRKIQLVSKVLAMLSQVAESIVANFR